MLIYIDWIAWSNDAEVGRGAEATQEWKTPNWSIWIIIATIMAFIDLEYIC